MPEGKRGRPTNEEVAERERVEAEGQRRVAARAGSFSASLYEFLKQHGSDFTEEPDQPKDATPAVLYLREYLETLANLERGLPPLPSMPDSGPWSLIESAALDVVANEPFKQIAARFGVNEKSMYQWSGKRRWKQRRALLLELQARQTSAAALVEYGNLAGTPTKGELTGSGQSEVDEAKELQNLVRRSIAVFEKALENGQVQFKSARDMETLIKLLGWLQGRADKIIEHQHVVTIEDLETTIARVTKRMRFTPEMAGVVREGEFTVLE